MSQLFDYDGPPISPTGGDAVMIVETAWAALQELKRIESTGGSIDPDAAYRVMTALTIASVEWLRVKIEGK